MAEFVLNVQEIDGAGKHYDFPVRKAWLAESLADTDVRPDATTAEGQLSLRVHKQGEDLVIVGSVSTALVTPCARCLEDAPMDVRADVHALLTARSGELRPEPDEVELTPEELDRHFYTGDRVVLDDMVREHLLLEVPIKPLCRDDCPGITVPEAVAGPSDLRAASAPDGVVDPRLAPLMNLVGKLKPTEE